MGKSLTLGMSSSNLLEHNKLCSKIVYTKFLCTTRIIITGFSSADKTHRQKM